jgi:hypothetical protein
MRVGHSVGGLFKAALCRHEKPTEAGLSAVGLAHSIRQSAAAARKVIVCRGEVRMRYLIAAMLAWLLAACGSVPHPISGSGCSTKSQCEIEAYMNAR